MRRVMQVQARNEAKSSGIRHRCWFQAPFDIFDENVLQPSRKKRAAFASTLHEVYILIRVRYAIVQFKKKKKKKKKKM